MICLKNLKIQNKNRMKTIKEYLNNIKGVSPHATKETLEEVDMPSEPLDDKELKGNVINFLKDNPNPSDEMVHAFAENIGYPTEMVEQCIYRIASDHVAMTDTSQEDMEGETHPDEEFNPEQLSKGIAVEMEHTDDPELAKKISKDHLLEDPEYYTKLAKMEGED